MAKRNPPKDPREQNLLIQKIHLEVLKGEKISEAIELLASLLCNYLEEEGNHD